MVVALQGYDEYRRIYAPKTARITSEISIDKSKGRKGKVLKDVVRKGLTLVRIVVYRELQNS
jgi:hypothetical protein